MLSLDLTDPAAGDTLLSRPLSWSISRQGARFIVDYISLKYSLWPNLMAVNRPSTLFSCLFNSVWARLSALLTNKNSSSSAAFSSVPQWFFIHLNLRLASGLSSSWMNSCGLWSERYSSKAVDISSKAVWYFWRAFGSVGFWLRLLGKLTDSFAPAGL